MALPVAAVYALYKALVVTGFVTSAVGTGLVIGHYLNEGGESATEPSLDDMKKNPPEHSDYKSPKNWDGERVKNPNGPGSGWPAKNKDVWVPTDHKGTHGPHWDVQHPDGTHTPIYP